jgi:hypothetical protein
MFRLYFLYSGEYVAETDDDVCVKIYDVVAPSTLFRIFVKAPGFLLPKQHFINSS